MPPSRRRRHVRCAAFALMAALATRSVNNATPPPDIGSTSSAETTPAARPASNVTLTFNQPRKDRMGSRLRIILGAWVVARHHGWNFCSPTDPVTEALQFTMCASSYETMMMLEGPKFRYQDDKSITEAGVYYIDIRGKVNTLWQTITENEKNNASMWEDGAVEEWRRMILGSHVRPELEEKLWLNEGSAAVLIAVHVRRGDITPQRRNDVYVGDDQTIALIEMARYYVRLKRGPDVQIEVHLFSEDYGVTNWTRYDGLVDRLHLAPPGPEDVQLNLRDWKHFVEADVLVVGGTFSHIPGMSRPDPRADGFPLTLERNLGKMARGKFTYWHWDPASVRMVTVAPFPDGTMTARIGVGGRTADERGEESGACVDSEYATMELCFVRSASSPA